MTARLGLSLAAALALVALVPVALADDVCEGPVCVPVPCTDPVVGCAEAYCREHFAACQLHCLYGNPCFRP
jgi:hypothetical protein